MAFGSFDQHGDGKHTVAEINMVPLIDVMLVLLIIFMITAPMMTHAVKIELPKVSSQPQEPVKDPIMLSIDSTGKLFWNSDEVTRAVRLQRLQALAQAAEETELQIRADQAVAYRLVAETLADAANAGVTRIGFVSEPDFPRQSL
jgi:biopolymer transport protein ExbD